MTFNLQNKIKRLNNTYITIQIPLSNIIFIINVVIFLGVIIRLFRIYKTSIISQQGYEI